MICCVEMRVLWFRHHAVLVIADSTNRKYTPVYSFLWRISWALSFFVSKNDIQVHSDAFRCFVSGTWKIEWMAMTCRLHVHMENTWQVSFSPLVSVDTSNFHRPIAWEQRSLQTHIETEQLMDSLGSITSLLFAALEDAWAELAMIGSFARSCKWKHPLTNRRLPLPIVGDAQPQTFALGRWALMSAAAVASARSTNTLSATD